MASFKLLAGFCALFVLGLLGCGTASSIRTHDKSSENFKKREVSDTCRLRSKTLWTAEIDWSNLTGINMVTVLGNASFTVYYCSGRCDRHRQRRGAHSMADQYTAQMLNLTKGCAEQGKNCDELTPCCVPKRYHGSKHTAIEFNRTTVPLQYIGERGFVLEYIHHFVWPKVCQCQ
jgi:hypothetical protein